MTLSEFVVNVGVGGSLGKLGDVGLSNTGLYKLAGLRETRALFGRSGVGFIQTVTSGSINTLTGVSGNTIQNIINMKLK